MLEGPLVPRLLKFALPVAATNVLQQLFNSADVAIVGLFAGSDALAAVGSNGAIINIIINLFVGLSIGANVVVAHLLGQGDTKNVQRAVHTSMAIAIIGGIFLAIFGQIVATPLLRLLDTPAEILPLSAIYLRIYFAGMPFLMLYNFAAAILRAKGDTRRPLMVLIGSGAINVGLNLLFVISFHMSVAGVALATLIATAYSSIMLIHFLRHEEESLRLHYNKIHIDRHKLRQIAKIGIPSGLQGMVFSFSNLLIQSAINSLGSTAMAASSVSLNFEYYCYFVANAFGMAATSFVSQNYGAGNLRRCRQITRLTFLLGLIFTTALGMFFVIAPRFFSGFFTKDESVIQMSILRIRVITAFEFLNASLESLSGTMRAYGKAFTPMILCILGVCGVRILWLYTVFAANPTFFNICVVFPVSWAVTIVLIATAYFIYVNNEKKTAKGLVS